MGKETSHGGGTEDTEAIKVRRVTSALCKGTDRPTVDGERMRSRRERLSLKTMTGGHRTEGTEDTEAYSGAEGDVSAEQGYRSTWHAATRRGPSLMPPHRHTFKSLRDLRAMS